MASINSNPRPGYVYDANTDQWFEIAGKVNTSAEYTWSAQQIFDSSVLMNSSVIAKNFNIFLNPAARDSAIPSPIYGTMAFLKQNSGGNTVNDLQIYDGSAWLSVVDPLYDFNLQSSSYTLAIADSFKMIEMSAGGTLTIPLDSSVNFPVGTAIDVLQTGTSQVTIAGDSGVTVNGTPGLKIRAQWSSATLIKRGNDTWVVTGDLVA